MIYLFQCPKCKKKKELSLRVSEYYIPECKCGNKMKRVYTAPGLSAGALNIDNLPK